jgi:Fe2+ or Zn2+ uptake regulation protein
MRSSTRQIAEEIRRYCTTHPNARDTVEGITWWIAAQRQEDMKLTVSAAVQWLVQQGLLQRHELPDGSIVFGCEREASGHES